MILQLVLLVGLLNIKLPSNLEIVMPDLLHLLYLDLYSYFAGENHD